MQRVNTFKDQLLKILKGAASTGALATAVAVAPTPAQAGGEEAVAVLLGAAALYAAYEAGDDRREHRVDHHHAHYDYPTPAHHYREKHYHKKHHKWRKEKHKHKHKHCNYYRKKHHRDHAYYHDRREHYWRYRDWHN